MVRVMVLAQRASIIDEILTSRRLETPVKVLVIDILVFERSRTGGIKRNNARNGLQRPD